MPNQPVAGTEPDGQNPSTIVNVDIQEVAVDPEQTQSCDQETSSEYCPTDGTETLLTVSVATANPETPNTFRSQYLREVREHGGLRARTKQTQRRHLSEASDEEMQLGQSDEETRVASASSAEEEGPVGLSLGPKEQGQTT